jgi:hypothetical protein
MWDNVLVYVVLILTRRCTSLLAFARIFHKLQVLKLMAILRTHLRWHTPGPEYPKSTRLLTTPSKNQCLTEVRTFFLHVPARYYLIHLFIFVAEEVFDLPAYAISFRFRNAIQVWAAVFKMTETVSSVVGTNVNYFSLLEDGSLHYSSASTSLIILSLTLPIFVSLVIGIIVFFTLKTKKEELRSNFFLSSIEGSRLNGIEIFRGLSLNPSAFSTHVSKLARNAPAAANLQTRHTINLLKFLALFEIGSKFPQDGSKHQVWYMKVVRSTFSLSSTIKNSFRQLVSCITEFVPALEGYAPLIVSDSDPTNSFLSLCFKKIDTKFGRRLIFPIHVLDKLRCNSKTNVLDVLNVRTISPEALTQVSRHHEFECCVRVLRHKSAQNELQTTSPDRDMRTTCSGECDALSAGAAAYLCVKLDQKHFSDLEVAKFRQYVHVGSGLRLSRSGPRRTVTPFPIEGSGRFVISQVFDSSPCVAHVAIESVNSSAFVDWESFAPNLELTMHIDDPYVIDDDTIDWFKKKELLESRNLKHQIGQVFNDDPIELKKLSKSKKADRPTDSVWSKKDFILKFNPYEHRALLVCCAIFFDASEAYRSISAATGVEFFMDMRTLHLNLFTAPGDALHLHITKCILICFTEHQLSCTITCIKTSFPNSHTPHSNSQWFCKCEKMVQKAIFFSISLVCWYFTQKNRFSIIILDSL